MKNYVISSAANTDATPPSEPASTPVSKSAAGGTPLSEAELLQRQAQTAKMAVIATGRDILDSLEKIVDIAAWTRLYPLLAAGAACAVGFVGGCLLKPRHRHEARRHWQAIKAGWQEAETPSAEPTTNGATRPDDQSDWGATLIKELVKTVRPALLALIASAIAGARQTHDPEHQPPESRTE